jgi:hypothetical protein
MSQKWHTSDVARTILVFFTLALAGVGYNALVEWFNRRHRDHGYTAILVAAGVTMTEIGVEALPSKHFVFRILAYIASGTPMLMGDILRFLDKQKASSITLERILEAHHDRSQAPLPTPKTVAIQSQRGAGRIC